MIALRYVLIHPLARALRFAAGECGESERGHVADHLTRCARCRAAVAATRELARAARELETPLAPPSVLARAIAERAAGTRTILPANSEVAPPRRRTWGLVAAAALFVLVGIGSRAFWNHRHPSGTIAATGDSVPTLRTSFFAAGVLPAEAEAQEAPAGSLVAPPIADIDASGVRPFALQYERRVDTGDQRPDTTERGTLSVERATYDGVPAWRVFSAWHGHEADLPETTFVERRTLRPLYRVARNIGPSRFTVVQHFVNDSVVGRMWSATRTRDIARSLPPSQAPFLVGDAVPVLMLHSVPIAPRWRGSASIVGWGAAPSDLLYPVTIRVVGTETVTVPAGTFPCWRLALTDGRRTHDVWVRRSDRLVVMSRRSGAAPGPVSRVVLVAETQGH